MDSIKSRVAGRQCARLSRSTTPTSKVQSRHAALGQQAATLKQQQQQAAWPQQQQSVKAQMGELAATAYTSSARTSRRACTTPMAAAILAPMRVIQGIG